MQIATFKNILEEENAMSDKKEKNKKKLNEEYGEFVPTEFNWIPLENQKEKAERLDKITKKNR